MVGAIAAIFAMGIKEGERKAAMTEVTAAVKKHGERIDKNDERITTLDKTVAVVNTRLASIDEAAADTRRMVRRLYERTVGNGGGA